MPTGTCPPPRAPTKRIQRVTVANRAKIVGLVEPAPIDGMKAALRARKGKPFDQ